MTSTQRNLLFAAGATIGIVAAALLIGRHHAAAATPSAANASSSEALAAAPGWVDVEGGTQHLGARIDGVVEEVAVHAGDAVAANALLVRFDNHQASLDAQLAELEVQRSQQQQAALAAQLRRVRMQLQRLQPLVDAQAEPLDALTEQQHAQADLAAQAAQAKLAAQTAALQLQSARARLARMELRAPRAGRVLRVSAHAGEAVSSGGELIWFAADGPLIVRAELDERLFGEVQIGMKADISPEYDDAKRYAAQVTRVAASVGPVRDLPDVRAAAKDDRVVECDLQLSAPAPLLIGQRVLVRIHTAAAGNESKP
ncbi:MAG: HlyD family efflux transporter periplasmic adaptor subunit [Nevskia sp.]|nr:HlyD family efflux transporter periplasmic adaptor subunit [Nevskia sp.]